MGRLKDAITTLDHYDPSYYNDRVSLVNQFQDDNQIIVLKDDASMMGNNTNYNDNL